VLTTPRSRQDAAADVRACAASAPTAGPWAAGTWKSFPTPDRRILGASIGLQLVLATLFGHGYDMRVFMATGYLVGTGQNPYVPQNLVGVFHHVYFTSLTTVGYPPPWPLVLGLLYRSSFALGHDFLVYNLAIKLPVIAANVGLAYLVAAILQNLGASPAVSRRAWVFVLLNPLLLYFGAAWGQIDSIVALLAMAALALVFAQRWGPSALVLALAVCVKPTAVPVALAAVAYLADTSWRRAGRYAAVFLGGVLTFYVAPFFIFGWSTSLVSRRWNAEFITSGGLTSMTVARLFRDPLVLTGRCWLLGLAWVPALVLGVLALRRSDGGFDDLLKKSTVLVLIFFLTRTWLSEPNVVLLLPLVLILTAHGELDRRALTAVWLIPLAFTLFNASPLQLLWAAFPGEMERSLAWVARYHVATLTARAAMVIAWQVAGWWTVVACLRRSPARAQAPATEAVVP